MPLPRFNDEGDLPEGVYESRLSEVLVRFSAGTAKRQAVAAQLARIFNLVEATGKLERMVIFGSFITAKPEPNDVDIVLIMRDDFNLGDCEEELGKLFDHGLAQSEFGASIFWIRDSMLLLESVAQFVEHWQLKRDGKRRGIVEVRRA
jgi:hypothetical protein